MVVAPDINPPTAIPAPAVSVPVAEKFQVTRVAPVISTLIADGGFVLSIGVPMTTFPNWSLRTGLPDLGKVSISDHIIVIVCWGYGVSKYLRLLRL